MKTKTTKKQIRANFTTILSFGYCRAQNLLYYKNPFAYSAGVNGWSCDYYEVDNKCISTGYLPIGKSTGYALVHEYEKKAEIVVNNNALPYTEKVAAVDALLIELLDKL